MIDVRSLQRAGGFLINDPRFGNWVNQECGDRSGVYYLRCNDSTRVPLHIERRKAIDPDGIVYIGGAISLIDRVSKVRRSICAAAHEYGYTDWRVHQLGKRFWVHPELFDIYPFESLYVDVWWFPDFKLDQRLSSWMENCHLDQYLQRFDEFPPLNAPVNFTGNRSTEFPGWGTLSPVIKP